MARASDIRDFWLSAGPEKWYVQDPAFDETIRNRFTADWTAAAEGGLSDWAETPEGALSLLLLTDQFPRNMFRDQGLAFSTDALARAVARQAIEAGFDRQIDGPARQFFYLPFMHSEDLADQDYGISLFDAHMPESEGNRLHARAHREVIARFGRFPHRNAALARRTTPEETSFLEAGGYGAVVRALQDAN